MDSKLSSKGNSSNAVGDIVGDDYSINSSLKILKFVDLKRVTRDFSQDFLLNTVYGLSEVFLGWVDKNTFFPSREGFGIAVAIIRYDTECLQCWQTELTIVGQLTHPNIIRLLGYCNDKKHKGLLVHEYMQNRNLSHFLYTDARDVAEPLSWETRLKIMIGIARGLDYMHSSKDQVIHRDVNPSNILLDKEFNAKLGGFYCARFIPESREYVTTCVAGTLGYLAPEYEMTGHCSVKSDIYSFGVVLLVTLTGHRPIECNFNLVKWATPLLAYRSGLNKIIDPRLGPNYPLESAFEYASLALRCVAEDLKDRPSSEEVLESLEQIYIVHR